jgi:hypothetical protein
MHPIERWGAFIIIVCSLEGWLLTWRSKEKIVPNMIVIADPQHYPDTVQLGWWWLRGYQFHCLVVDKETKQVRPFLEHAMCRAEAQQELMKYNEVVPYTPSKPIPAKPQR